LRAASSGGKPSPLNARRGEHKPEENPPANKKEKEENKSWISEQGTRRKPKKTTISNCQFHPIFRLSLSKSASARPGSPTANESNEKKTC